jgi:hypothetical protein
MTTDRWELAAEVYGELESELIRGLLEAGGIEVFLNQEGAGRAYGLGLGALGKVQILVPSRDIARAKEILEDYESGKYSSSDSSESEPVDPDEDI